MSPNLINQVQNGGAVVGDTIKVRMQNGLERIFILVSQQDAAPEKGMISNISPIGKALSGCQAGEKRQYSAGNNTFEMEVLEIVKPAAA